MKSRTRWVLDGASPSGKNVFRCLRCGRRSLGPDKDCPRGCGLLESRGIMVGDAAEAGLLAEGALVRLRRAGKIE